MVRVRHRQLITTINVIRNLLPVTCYISPAIIYILFRQLLQEAEFCHIPFFCLSISEYRICNSIFISYSIRHYSAYLCLFSSLLQNHLHKITPIYFSDQLIQIFQDSRTPAAISGDFIRLSIISYQPSAVTCDTHVSPEALQGDTLLSISPLYQLPIQYIFTAAGLYFINPLPASYV